MAAYDKLVRDKIPELLDEKGIKYELRIAPEEERSSILIKKFSEEVAEFLKTPTPAELADVMETIRALQKRPEYIGVETLQLQKREERGGFDKFIIIKGDDEDKPLR